MVLLSFGGKLLFFNYLGLVFVALAFIPIHYYNVFLHILLLRSENAVIMVIKFIAFLSLENVQNGLRITSEMYRYMYSFAIFLKLYLLNRT